MKTVVRLLALGVILTLLALMLGPATTVESSVSGIDKVGHLVGFFLIALCVAVLKPDWRGLRAVVAAVLIGAAVELIQGRIGRDASWGDLVADLVGAVVAGALTPMVRPVYDWLARRD